MDLARVMNDGVPFIPNVTVFLATAINDGAVLVTGASTTAQGATILVTLDTTDVLNVIGVSQVSTSRATASPERAALYNIGTDGFPNEGTTAGIDYLPVCVNPGATFFALYSTTTGAGTAADTVGTWTAGTTTAAQRGTTGTDVLGGWVFSLASVNSAGTTPTFSGALRYISNQSATTHVTLLTAMNISTDSHMIWVDRTWKKSGILNSTADLLRSTSGSSGTGFQLNGTRMARIENYVTTDNNETRPLRRWVHDGLNGLTGVTLKSELTFTSYFLFNGPSS